MTAAVSIIGAGSVGLGLLYPWAAGSGASVAVINRKSPKPESRYREVLGRSQRFVVSTPLGSWECGPVELHEYDEGDLQSPASRACIDLIQRCNTILVSVRVENHARVADLIAESCRARIDAPLNLVAFENTIGASQKLAKQVAERLSASDAEAHRPLRSHGAVADRTCHDPLIEDGSGTVALRTETFGEIVIEDSAAGLLPNIHGNSNAHIPTVHVVPTGAVDLFESRKFWLVNGTHTALGVLCSRADVQVLNRALDDADNVQFIRGLHSEWISVLAKLAVERRCTHALLTQAELKKHADRMFDRVRELPDLSVQDVLRELTEPKIRNMVRLLEKLDGRLAEQIRHARQLAIPDVPFSSFILADAVKVLHDYADKFL